MAMIDKPENPERIWVCEECNAIFSDEEIRKCESKKEWGHTCKARKYKIENRCDSYCKKYLPEN